LKADFPSALVFYRFTDRLRKPAPTFSSTKFTPAMMRTHLKMIIAHLIILVITLPATLLSQGLTPEQLVTISQTGSVVMSPDGRHIAYTLSVPREADEAVGRNYSELYIIPAAGGTAIPVISKPSGASSPQWLADGRLAFTTVIADQDSRTQVYAVQADGSDLQRLSFAPNGVIAFSVSPDMRRIAFTSRDPIPTAEQTRRQQGYDMIVYGEHERPVRLWMQNIGDTRPQAITPHNRMVWDFAWADDSNRLSVRMSEETSDDHNQMFSQIYTMRTDGLNPRHLVKTDGKLGMMAWSPDGKKLAYLGAMRRSDPLPQRIWIADTETGATLDITPDGYEGTPEWISWIDDNTVLFNAVEGTLTALNRIPANGGAITRIAGGGAEVFRSISYDARKRTFAAAVNTRNHPNEVYTGTFADGRFNRVTRHNAFLNSVTFGRQSTIEWPGADGLTIQGVLVLPTDYREGQRYPLAILPHGGPEGVSMDGWNTRALYPAHVLAANGYVVLKPNYRGSAGRGSHFAMANHRDLGGKEFEDVLLGIDHLDRRGLIDPKRVGMSGTSYGGYFSAWAGTRHSDRFAATITFAGLSNWISFTGTTDIPYEMSDVHWDLWWFDNPGQYWDRSPVAHLNGASTPILVAHGLADIRVHPEQSLQLYNFLKIKDIPTGLVMYPREPHGLLERANQLDFMHRMLDWFNAYLVTGNER
jgi:dipeptidyl aminopeptidase/acylaminoacyl peptidase